MKTKLILLMLVCMTAMAACAQEASVQTQEPVKEKKFTITPRAGMAVSRFKGDFIYKNAENIWGPALGVDAEYQFSSLMGVALGVFYLQEGGKIDYHNRIDLYGQVNDASNHRFRKKVVSVPLTLKMHTPVPGLSVFVGGGYERLLSCSYKALYNVYLPPSMSQRMLYEKKENADECFEKDGFFAVGGLSYVYKDVVLDLRYSYGISKNDDQSAIRNYWYSVGKKVKQHALMITLGYQLHL